MAQHRTRQGEWPPVKRERDACFATPDGYLWSTRGVAGPLRYGTESRVGPRSQRIGYRGARTDFGMDRLEQRPVDAIGQKYPETDNPTRLIANRARKY